MSHDHPHLDLCSDEALHTLLKYVQEHLEGAEDNLKHAERTNSMDLIFRYEEWIDRLRCMKGEISYHIAKRESKDAHP